MHKLVLVTAALLSLAATGHADYQPLAEQVVDNVYAIVGPLGQRSADNDGLNANFGFIVTDAVHRANMNRAFLEFEAAQ